MHAPAVHAPSREQSSSVVQALMPTTIVASSSSSAANNSAAAAARTIIWPRAPAGDPDPICTTAATTCSVSSRSRCRCYYTIAPDNGAHGDRTDLVLSTRSSTALPVRFSGSAAPRPREAGATAPSLSRHAAWRRPPSRGGEAPERCACGAVALAANRQPFAASAVCRD